MMALQDRVSMTVDRASFDDLVTLVTQAPPWEKDRVQGIRVLLRALGEAKADAPEQILQRWTWKLARAARKVQDRRASAEFPDGKRLLGAVANSRGHRHEENVAKLVSAALSQPIEVGTALLASAEGYTPRANQLIDAARERLGTLTDVANALAENLPAPKAHPGRSRRRRRKKKGGAQTPEAQAPVAVEAAPAAAEEQRAAEGKAPADPAAAEPPPEPEQPAAAEAAAPVEKPKRRRTKKAAESAAAEPAVADAADAAAEAEAVAGRNGQPEEAPKPRRRRRKAEPATASD
jgi:hypothetical protein